jgi:hypothetical protein
MIGILGGALGHADAESAALLHALEDEVDAEGAPVSPGGARQAGRGSLWEPFLGPFDRDFMIAAVGLDPVAVIGGALAQHIFC